MEDLEIVLLKGCCRKTVYFCGSLGLSGQCRYVLILATRNFREFELLKFPQNPWTWVNLTNVVWVEQPIGTGLTQGEANAITEELEKMWPTSSWGSGIILSTRLICMGG